MKEILVPLDGSKFGESVIPVALALAGLEGGRIHLVHVEESRPLVGGRIEEPSALELGDAYVAALEARIREEAGDVPLESRVLGGRVVETLLDYARDASIDLIVMSTHGRGSLSRFWLGSVADGVIRGSGVPVLLLRPDLRRTAESGSQVSCERLLVAMDHSEESERALATAVRLGRHLGAEMRLLEVVEVPPIPFVPEGVVPPVASPPDLGAARTRLQRLAEEVDEWATGIDVRARADDEAAEGILAEAQAWPADLIVLGTRGRGGAARMLLGSVADKVVRGTRRPVLVVPGSAGMR